MKRWTGGILITLLALLLFLSYTAYTLLTTTIAAAAAAVTTATATTRVPSSSYGEKQDEGGEEEEGRRHLPATIPTTHFRKPHLYSHYQGLDDLFPSHKNATFGGEVEAAAREAKLAWAQMRALLPRSDALPDTANGVREAAAAWKELVAAVDAEKKAAADEPAVEHQNCPFSVSGNQSGAVLEIPCGLVQDSAITVVGVPSPSGSFQIELVGSRLPGEEAPVVLHYSVSLGGGEEGPVIVQNTWRTKDGWGVEERCPSVGLKTNLTGQE